MIQTTEEKQEMKLKNVHRICLRINLNLIVFKIIGINFTDFTFVFEMCIDQGVLLRFIFIALVVIKKFSIGWCVRSLSVNLQIDRSTFMYLTLW